MDRDKIEKHLGFTHRGSMYGFSGYINLENEFQDTFKADYILTDFIVDAIIYLDSLIGFNRDGFKFKIYYEL